MQTENVETFESTETATEVSAHDQANADAAAAIAAIEAEWNADADGEEQPAPAVESVVEAAAEADGAPVEAGADPEPAATEPAEEDRSIARLVEREVAVRGREAEIAAREEQYKALETEVTELREKAKSYQGDFHDRLRLKVGDTLRAAGHDPDHVVRLYLAEKMTAEGKPLPPELRDALRDAEYEYKFRTQEQKLTEYQRQQEASRWVAGIELGARTYLNQGISKDAPNFAAAAKANPEWAFKAIMDEIANDVQSRAGKDLGATVLTYDDAAKRAEAKLASYRKLLGVDPPTASTSEPPKPVSKAVAKGSSPTAPKPLVAQKSLSQKELEEAGIAAGIAEHRRIESAKKSAQRS